MVATRFQHRQFLIEKPYRNRQRGEWNGLESTGVIQKGKTMFLSKENEKANMTTYIIKEFIEQVNIFIGRKIISPYKSNTTFQ